MHLPASVLAYGVDSPLPASTALRAGGLSLRFENGALRHIRVGETLAMAQIYAAVRDHNWQTIPLTLSLLEQDIQADHFYLRFQCDHRQGQVEFGWVGTITGSREGVVTFDFEGEARTAFLRNRIGFCILHPASCAGTPLTLEHADGSSTEGLFPLHIAPHQPFKEIRAITHEALPGLRIEVRMEGDIFEMEDQRNWSDASYKTYCTPLRIPYPVQVNAGDQVRQQVTLRLSGMVPKTTLDAAPVELILDEANQYPLSPIGLCSASHEEPLSNLEIKRLHDLNLSFLRFEVHQEGGYIPIESLKQAVREAEALSLPMEIALHLNIQDQGLDQALQEFGAQAETLKPPVLRWFVFDQVHHVTPPGLLHKVRNFLARVAPQAKYVGGTDAYFTHLNRDHAFVPESDGLCYSTNPQAHATDNTTLIECLPILQNMVETARQFSQGRSIHVGPVTLKRRWNPDATAPEPFLPDELPDPVDPRQMSLLGAGWTLGVLKYLTECRADSITLGETTGWRGVMERASGSLLPEKFRALPSGIFPVWYVLRSWADFKGGSGCALHSSDPLRVDGTMLIKGEARRLVIANLTDVPQSVRLKLPRDGYRLQIISALNALSLMRDPNTFSSMTLRFIPVQEGQLGLDLPAFALAFIEP